MKPVTEMTISHPMAACTNCPRVIVLKKDALFHRMFNCFKDKNRQYARLFPTSTSYVTSCLFCKCILH